MVDRGVAGAGARAAAVALPAAGFLALALAFARVQNVWIDESTQLLGSTLPLGRLFAWLAGQAEPLGVPGDRMPPLGYLVDWSWLRIGGAAPYGFRLVHLAFAFAGVVALLLLALRRYGPAAALATGLLAAASPQLVATGVEIRAYPLFFAATVLQLWLLDGLVRHGLGARRLAAFAAAGLGALYVHFFGLVSTSALFAGLIAARVRRRGELARVGVGWGATLLLALGLLPFVGGAQAISHGEEMQADLLSEAWFYLPRIYGHAAMLLHPTLTVVLFFAVATLLAVAVARAWPGRAWRAPASFEAALAVALLAGVAVTIAAGAVAHGFNPMKPSYSIWMVPLIALLAGAACAPGARAARLARGAALVAAAALLPSTAGFARHLAWFAHGPDEAIAAAVGGDAGGTAIVYVGPGWAYGYFPLVRRYGRGFAQYLLDEAGTLHPLTDADPATPPVDPHVLDGRRRLLVVDIRPRTGDDLRALLAGDADPLAFTAPDAALPGWTRTATVVEPGLYWLRLARMERNAA